ncbi:hypothetical protein KCP75_22760 [Salmonella enterica subsp. enterica]|nr:hypothetical protein KCP75_22760 [Salmonella enterica subsp. enterica]
MSSRIQSEFIDSSSRSRSSDAVAFPRRLTGKNSAPPTLVKLLSTSINCLTPVVLIRLFHLVAPKHQTVTASFADKMAAVIEGIPIYDGKYFAGSRHPPDAQPRCQPAQCPGWQKTHFQQLSLSSSFLPGCGGASRAIYALPTCCMRM